MAKGKVHKRLVDLTNEEAPRDVALCNQKHRDLLPLALVDEWTRVTCAKCKRREPAGPTVLERVASWFEGLRVLVFGPDPFQGGH